MSTSHNRISPVDWGLLLFLSLLWSGSFLFVGIAVKELPPLVIVAARVVIAAAALIPVHLLFVGPLPRDRHSWMNFAVMGVINNALPFTLIATGQTMQASGLASVINATTPLFAVALLVVAGQEKLVPRKMAGIVVGITGVMILKGGSAFGGRTEGLGVLCGLGAAFCYGLSTLWAKLHLKSIPAMTMATGQLVCSSMAMAIVAFSFDQPSLLVHASGLTWIALLGLALLSTSLAYLVFFRIIAGAGPSNVQLVTMMIPVTAILMGYLFLGEALDLMEIAGAAIIIGALAIIDGRIFSRFGSGRAGDHPA